MFRKLQHINQQQYKADPTRCCQLIW